MRRVLWAVLAVGVVAASSASAAPSGTREAELQAVLLDAGDGGVGAHVSRVTARITKNRARVPSVGILSAEASAPDDQWSATLWQAAFVATAATQSSLLDAEFSLRVAEPLRDGSAGLLTAATLSALLTGKKLLPGTSMVGAVNPDGSAGPVDELVTRLRAAAAGGVKRLGVPFGARQPDVVSEAQRLGVEVKELAGLDDAYLFLTGEKLARPAPLTDADMELWPAEVTAVGRVTAQVRGELEAEQPRLLAALEGVRTAAPLRARLERTAQQAADLERSGDVVRALVVWSSALTTTRVAAQELLMLRAQEGRDTAALVEQLKVQADALPVERLALRKEIDARFPPTTTRADDLYAMDVLESLVTAASTARIEDEARALTPTDAAFATRARQLAEALLRAREDLRNGQRFVGLYASLPVLKKSLAALDAERLASSWAAASRVTFPASLTPTIERDASFSEVAGYAPLLRSETDARARLVLAARQSLYAAHLADVYGALGGELSDKGVLSVRNPRALSSQLEHARSRVLQSCGRARREAGMVPFAARLRYLNARAAREGTDRQKTEALADLWLANWWCELASR